MSIKIVHIAFIALSTVCAALFAVWAIQYALYADQGVYMAAGIGSVFLGILLIVYGIFFYKKIKALSL